METFEKIIDLGWPRATQVLSLDKRPLRFRVTCRAVALGEDEVHESSLAYHDFASARRGYRNVLLALYKCRKMASFAICLNHYVLPKWEGAICTEAVAMAYPVR